MTAVGMSLCSGIVIRSSKEGFFASGSAMFAGNGEENWWLSEMNKDYYQWFVGGGGGEGS